jgi:hypothetical protein
MKVCLFFCTSELGRIITSPFKYKKDNFECIFLIKAGP